MKKTIVGLVACSLLVLGLGGCSSGGEAASSDEVDYADDEAMEVIAEGWCARSDALEDVTALDEDYAARLKEGVQIEIDNDQPLKDRQFEDTGLQEDVIAYLNLLEGQKDVLESYSMDDFEFYDAWDKVYDERSTLLKKFVDEYGFSVDEKYQNALDDLLANGTAAQKKSDEKDAIEALVAGAEWDKQDDGDGYFTYTAVVENTSDYDFKDVGLVLGLYDADGVRTEAYASTNDWKRGDKVKFDAGCYEADAERVEATVDYYDVTE